MACSPSTSTNDTVVLLLPSIPGVEESAKKSLLNLHGVLGVAVHSFDTHIVNKLGQITKKWYVSVTYNSLWITSDKIRETVQTETKKPVLDVNKGKLKKIAEKKTETAGEIEPKTEVYALNEDDDESAAEHEGMGGTSNLDHIYDWYDDCDSDSDDDDSKPAKQAGYLSEDAGKPRAFVNMFAPLVGGFGIDTAQTLTEEYNSYSVQPWNSQAHEKSEGSKGWFDSLFGR